MVFLIEATKNEWKLFVYMECGVRMYTKNCQDRSANEQVHNGLIYSAYRARHIFRTYQAPLVSLHINFIQ
jgi:hypothetical protein